MQSDILFAWIVKKLNEVDGASALNAAILCGFFLFAREFVREVGKSYRERQRLHTANELQANNGVEGPYRITISEEQITIERLNDPPVTLPNAHAHTDAQAQPQPTPLPERIGKSTTRKKSA